MVKIIASALIIQICVTVTQEDGDDLRARGSDGPWRFVDNTGFFWLRGVFLLVVLLNVWWSVKHERFYL